MPLPSVWDRPASPAAAVQDDDLDYSTPLHLRHGRLPNDDNQERRPDHRAVLADVNGSKG
jgi:hypothetical protein